VSSALTVEIQGHRLHVTDEGTGEPALVFIHSFPLDGRMWDRQRRHFSAGRQVIVPDLRGAGRSEGPEDPAGYSVDGWATDLMVMLMQLQVERPVLVGAGSGADVVLAAARLFGDLPGGMVLAGPWPGTTLPEEIWHQTRQQARLAGGGRAGLVGGLEALRRRRAVEGDLDKIEVPVLLMRGQHDPLTTRDGLAALRDGLPDARLVEVPACGHLVNLDAPGAFDDEVDRFVRELGLEDAPTGAAVARAARCEAARAGSTGAEGPSGPLRSSKSGKHRPRWPG
jgi:3-oxoadipate enol-lactonase